MVAVQPLVLRDGQVLLVKRAKEPGKGRWAIPGGGIELGETVYEAARREIREECSVEISVERVLDVTERIIRDEEGRVSYHFVLICLLARYQGGEVMARSDAEDARWVTIGELDGLATLSRVRAMLARAELS